MYFYRFYLFWSLNFIFINIFLFFLHFLDDEKNVDPNKIISLKVNPDTPSTEIIKEQTYDDLYLVIEKLASKRRAGSDNLISKANIKLSNQKKLSKIPINVQSPHSHHLTPDKSSQNFQFQPNLSSQNKIQSMNLASNWSTNQLQPKTYTSQKNTKVKGLKTIDNPEILGFHKTNLSKNSNSDNCPKKIIFTEPNMDSSDDPNFFQKKKHSKFSNPKNNKKTNLEKAPFEKNRSMTNFLKPNYSTGVTSNSRPTKPTEEDFDSEEISEGKNCDTMSQEVRNTKENYLVEGGFDFEIIEKMNELSDGVKYTFGGVGISQDGEQQQNLEGEDEEIKGEDEGEGEKNRPNTGNLKELKNVRKF